MLLGILIGKKVDKTLIIEDAVPLFHQRVMTGPLEIAFDLIESLYLKDNLIIAGVYEATIQSKSND